MRYALCVSQIPGINADQDIAEWQAQTGIFHPGKAIADIVLIFLEVPDLHAIIQDSAEDIG